MIPFDLQYKESEDHNLIQQVSEGDSRALTTLIERHQQFIFNIALKFVRNDDDAADLTQEVLIKMIDKLDQYRSESNFRTWLYRIVLNHFLKAKSRKKEIEIQSFENFADFIDNAYNDESMSPQEQLEHEQQIKHIRDKCMAGVLLCLDREQRITYILGSIFNLKSNTAAEILNITPENFRKQLSRTKKDLYQFIENKCGLMNPNSPCRCHKKAKGFMKDGIVSSETNKFCEKMVQTISSMVGKKNEDLITMAEGKYLTLFTDVPYESPDRKYKIAQNILKDPKIEKLFHL